MAIDPVVSLSDFRFAPFETCLLPPVKIYRSILLCFAHPLLAGSAYPMK
jgi:hypothetical protein